MEPRREGSGLGESDSDEELEAGSHELAVYEILRQWRDGTIAERTKRLLVDRTGTIRSRYVGQGGEIVTLIGHDSRSLGRFLGTRSGERGRAAFPSYFIDVNIDPAQDKYAVASDGTITVPSMEQAHMTRYGVYEDPDGPHIFQEGTFGSNQHAILVDPAESERLFALLRDCMTQPTQNHAGITSSSYTPSV